MDANPDFIFRCLEEKHLAEKRLLFVLPSEILAQIYEEECNGKAEFAYLVDRPEEDRPHTGGDLWPRLCLAKRDFDHKGRESVFKKEAITAQYETGLLFVRRQSLKMASVYLTHIQTLLVPDGVLLLQSPHSVLYEDRYSVQKVLRNMSCREILLLPNNQHSDWLKKQLLSVWSPQRGAVEEDDVKVRKAFLALGQKDDAASVICVEPWVLEIPQSEIMSGKKTINGLREQYRPKPPKGKKRETKCYRYSEEIKVWYSLSNGRGRFSLYQLPTAAQARRAPLARGKRVVGPIPFRAKSVSEAEEKLRRRIFREPLKSTIQKLVESSCREVPITLRSFFFYQLDRLRENQSYRESVMEELLSAPSFGEISSADTITLEEYQAKMEKEFGDREKGEKLLLWRQLNLLLREGERWEPKRFYPNPISGYVNSLVEKDLDRQRMRESLAKRFFELREENVIWESITRGLAKDSVLLGCAISFYTGMSNSEICALDWGDCQSISGKTGKQFLVYKRMNAKGEIRHLGTENRGTYRRIPIVSSLWALLERRKEQVKKMLGMSRGGAVLDNELDTLPIVTEDTAAFEKRCSPSRLRAAKDRLERTAGITPLEGSLGDGQDQSSTDFNDYQGDLFRANFRQRALQTCLMSEAELNYLLGIALPSTFSKHYCDYINDFSQLLMAQKLERWAVLHPRREPEVSFENALTGARQTLRLQTGRYNQRVCTDLEIKAGPTVEGTTGQLLLDIKDDCGVDVEFYTVARKESGNELAG